MSDITCPRCQADLSSAKFGERGLVCPHCQNPLAGIAGLSAPDVDTDVRLGPRVTAIVLCVLIAVNVVVIAEVFRRGSGGDPAGLALCSLPLFGLLDVLVIAAILPPLWRRHRALLGRGRKDEVTTGCVLLMLIVGVIPAVIIVFFASCYGLLTREGFR